MGLCVVLWDLSICVTVIINRLALGKSPEIGNRSTKLDYSGLYIFWSFVSPFLCLLANITKQLRLPKITLQSHKCNQVFSCTKKKPLLDEQLGIYYLWVQEWHKVCVSSNQEVFVCFPLLLCFPKCSVYLHRFTVAQAHPNWLLESSTHRV